MSKAKAQGTSFENRVRDWFRSLGFNAERIAEGGSLDEGDVGVVLYGERWIMECKARQVLPVQATVSKALKKAGHDRVILWWKRLVPNGGSRRAPVAGVSEVVVMTPHTLSILLDDAYQAGADSVRDHW
jgi:hypothetical protein